MLNKYPLWKYILLMLALLAGVLYSMPNLYAPDPALQITGESSSLVLDQRALNRGLLALDAADISYFGQEINSYL